MENLEIRFPSGNSNVVVNKTADANIKIVGVGGAGTNAVTRMITANITGVQLYAVNTDNGSLKKSAAENRIAIGTGLGVGGDPVKGEMYAEEAIDKFKECCRVPTWYLLQPAWAAEREQVPHRLLQKYQKIWVY